VRLALWLAHLEESMPQSLERERLLRKVLHLGSRDPEVERYDHPMGAARWGSRYAYP
jgi:hypothetical protein